MAAAAAAPRRPGWMSIPGGPREPNRNDFRAKLQALGAERSKCFERLNEIRAVFSERADDSERDESRREVNALRARVKEIEGERRKLREARFAKDQEMRRLRNERRDVDRRLQEMTRELGDFRSLEDIEAAIDLVNMKMETGSGDLKFEKVCIKRLGLLEEAKSLVMQLQPMEDQLKASEEREDALQNEYRDLYESIEQIDKVYASAADAKAEKEKAASKVSGSQIERQRLMKEREEIRAKLSKINEQADAARKAFDEAMEAWEQWKVVAQAKYREQQEAQRKERERIWAEREKARKLARKAAKLARRRNPYENEIDACDTLVRYLEDKVTAAKREKEEQERLRKLATFDPQAFAPKGLKLAGYEDEWLFQDRTKKTPKPAPKKADAPAAAAKPSSAPANRERLLHYNQDKQRMFELVKLEAPVTYGQIPTAVEELKKKKAEFEKHIVKDLDDVSTDEEAEAEEVAPSEAPTDAPAPAAE